MIQRGMVIVLLILISVTGIAQAQEDEIIPTATQDSGLIIETGVDIYLPAAIRFRAKFALHRRDFESAELALFQESGFERAIPITLEENLIAETLDFVEVRVDQPLDVSSAPRLFEPLNYRWQLTTKENETYTFAGEIPVVPPFTGSEWQEMGDPPLTFYWYNPGLGIDTLRQNLTTVYDLLSSQTGLEKTFKFVIFEADYFFCDPAVHPETGKEILVTRGNPDYSCSPEHIDAFYRKNDLHLIQRQDAAFDTLEARLLGEIVTAFYENYWTVEVPEWFTEGLALFYRPYAGLQELVIAQQADLRGVLFTLSALQNPLPDNATIEQRDIREAQSYLLLLYLADTYGADTPFELALSLNGTESFEVVVEEITGDTVEDIYRAWKAWLQTRQAENAAAWNPYLQTTPTVTPTATITPIPPSRTPTSTATLTVTPTSTSLVGRATRTAFVAPTSTSTPVATASNTPLPPGSLPTVVPTATPPASSENEDGGLPCGTAAIIIPAIVIAAKHRRKK